MRTDIAGIREHYPRTDPITEMPWTHEELEERKRKEAPVKLEDETNSEAKTIPQTIQD